MAERSGTADLMTAVADALKTNGTVTHPFSSPPTDTSEQPRLTAAQQQHELRRLRRSHDALTKKVEALEKRTASLVGVLDQLKDLPLQRQILQSQVSSARIQQVAGVVSNVQAAAFGEAGSVFTRNNLTLAANQLFWIFLDPVLRRVGVISGTSPSIITWLAPLGSLVTGQLALANRQHVRFISGVATVKPGRLTLDVLRNRIADGFWEEFQRRTDIPVTALVLDAAPFIPFAQVRQGVLHVGVNPIEPVASPPSGPAIFAIAVQDQTTVRVAWVVDTGVAGG